MRPVGIDEAVSIVSDLIERHRGAPVAPEVRYALQAITTSVPQAFQGGFHSLFEEALRGFLNAAAEGHAFVTANRIEDRFGRTLDQNYPEASPAFLKLAISYWTIRCLVDDFDPEMDPAFAAANILREIERLIQLLFFPSYGPIKINPAQREADQRALLERYGANIDVEDLIKGNPILIRDRKEVSRGCLPAMATLLLLPMFHILALRWLSG